MMRRNHRDLFDRESYCRALVSCPGCPQSLQILCEEFRSLWPTALEGKLGHLNPRSPPEIGFPPASPEPPTSLNGTHRSTIPINHPYTLHLALAPSAALIVSHLIAYHPSCLLHPSQRSLGQLQTVTSITDTLARFDASKYKTLLHHTLLNSSPTLHHPEQSNWKSFVPVLQS